MDTNDQMIKADRKVRRLLIEVCIIGVLAAIALMRWVLPWGMSHLERQEPRVVLWVVEAVVAVIFLSVVPLAVYLYWLGRQVVRHRQFPPPGMKVVVDTRVIEGDRAVMALAVILLAVGLLGGLWVPYRLERAFAGRLKKAPAESGQQYQAT